MTAGALQPDARPAPKQAPAGRVGLGLWAALGMVMLCAPHALPARGFIVYNASDSMARGWYRIERAAQRTRAAQAPRPLSVGALVLVRLPAAAAALAARRGYLPAAVPLLKRVAAVAPQHVCVHARTLRIDDVPVAALRTHDGVHRPLPAWAACRSLEAGEILLLGDADAASFDSRYFGPVDVSAVIGIARPLRGGVR